MALIFGVTLVGERVGTSRETETKLSPTQIEMQ